MSDFFDLPTIIIIGFAVFVLLRLRSVLGTRTGTERRPLERRPPSETDDNVVPLKPQQGVAPATLDPDHRALKLEAEIEQFSHGDAALAQNLKAVCEADPAFGPKSFLEGAKGAYEMIVTAFAAGDRRALKSLLERDVFEGFESAISAREELDHTVEFTFVGLPEIEITDALVDKRVIQVVVRFQAEIVSATRDSTGQLIEGNADQVAVIADEWTFARPPRSRDPNWKLAATNQLS